MQVAHDKTLTKKTVRKETTEVLEDHADPTHSEANVKADRGEFKNH